MLHIVQFTEFTAVIGSDVLLEFIARLPAQVAAIDQEQDPPGPREFDQAIDKTYCGVGFTAACCHLDQRPGAVCSKGFL